LLAAVKWCISNHAHKDTEDNSSTDGGKKRSICTILLKKSQVKIPLGRFRNEVEGLY
jgi:hypothetical protein